MKKFYRLFRRNRRYYIEHVETRRQISLGTSNHAEAVRLWAARNEAAQAPGRQFRLSHWMPSARNWTLKRPTRG